MEHGVLAVAGCRQETGELPAAADGLFAQRLRQPAKRHRPDRHFRLPRLPCFGDLRLVFETEVQSRQSCWRISQGTCLRDTGAQNELVHSRQRAAYDWYSACCALRASSRSTVLIMEEGPVSAFLRCTVKWRRTASLKRNACSSSAITGWSASMLMHR